MPMADAARGQCTLRSLQSDTKISKDEHKDLRSVPAPTMGLSVLKVKAVFCLEPCLPSTIVHLRVKWLSLQVGTRGRLHLQQ